MKIEERQFESFLEGVRLRDVVLPSTGEIVQMPLVCRKDSIGTSSLWSVSRSKLISVLPIPDLVPVELSGDRSVIMVACYEFVNRPIAPFNEFVVGVPVRIGRDKPAPTLDDLGKPGSDLMSFRRHLIINSRLGLLVGNELMGCNKFMSDIEFTTLGDKRTCVVSEAGEEVIRFSIEISPNQSEFEFHSDSITTVCYKNGVLSTLNCPVVLKVPKEPPRNARLDFGSHPLGRLLQGLEVAPEPLSIRHATDVRFAPDVTDAGFIHI